ncbi:MAG TPA: hypothetical protein VF047_03950 [Nitrososphaeraceae archaeon]
MENKIIKSFLPTIFTIMVLAIIGNSIQNTVLAQSNSNVSSGNQTRAEITGEPETTIINKTTIPAQQTTVTVNETTSPIDKSALQPLQEQTLGDAPVDLSGFENKTIVKPTGEAKTTTVNQTTVPFEKTIVEGSNQTGAQQQGASDAASSAGQSANKTGEAIQGNASEVGAKVSEGAQKLGENVTEGAKGLAETIGKGLQDLAK